MKYKLCENIKKFRLLSGMNQVEFAAKMNVTKQCVSNWENGNVQPSIEMLARLADFFRVTTDCMLGRNEEKLIDVSELTDEQSAHIRLLILDLVRLNRENTPDQKKT